MTHWNIKFALAAALTTAAFSANCFAQIPVNMERTPVVEASEPEVAETNVVASEAIRPASTAKPAINRFDQLRVIPPVNPFDLDTATEPQLSPASEAGPVRQNGEQSDATTSPIAEQANTTTMGVVPVIPSESIEAVTPPLPAARATFSDVGVVEQPVADSRTTSAPALILRPTENNRQWMNDCVVEVMPRADSQAGYQLRIAVPDSVSAIEVVPNGDTQRHFRIQLDENAAVGTASKPAAANGSDIASPRPSHADASVADPSETSTEVLANRIHHENGSLAENPEFAQTEESGPYKINPFYQQRFASSRAVASSRVVGRNKQVELTNAQMELGQRTSGEMETTSQTQEVPTLDIPFEEIGAEKIDSANSEMNDLAELQIVDETNTPLVDVAVEPFGPATMPNGEEADFTVVLRNQSDSDVEPFDLRLSLPEGMQVTVLDRPADFDAEYQTVTWRVEGLTLDETLSIRYRVRSILNGRHTQALETGRSGVYGNLTTFSTSATSPAKR